MVRKPPIELNEENVLRIYNDCLADEWTTDPLPTRIFTKETCGKDSPEIIFSQAKIKEYGLQIAYLYGQLAFVHNFASDGIVTDPIDINAEMGRFNYHKQAWTQNNSILMAFYYLGVANETIFPFEAHETLGLSTELFLIKPTLSPSDPNYKASDN